MKKVFVIWHLLLGTPFHKGCPHLGRKEEVSNNADKSGQEEGRGLAVSGHPFRCSLFKRGDGIYKSFYQRHFPSLNVEK